MPIMTDPMRAEMLAAAWVEAWNAHDLDAILSHYHPDVEFTSPLVVARGLDPNGTLRGVEALRAYWSAGLERQPDLHFELLGVFRGPTGVTIRYRNHLGIEVAETMLVNDEGLVVRGIAHYADAEGR